jgi:hypothetical protein
MTFPEFFISFPAHGSQERSGHYKPGINDFAAPRTSVTRSKIIFGGAVIRLISFASIGFSDYRFIFDRHHHFKLFTIHKQPQKCGNCANSLMQNHSIL